MRVTRLLRPAWAGLTSAALLLTASPAAAADPYPGKTIRIVVATSTGTASDVAARYLATGLGKRLNTTVIVENKVGANGVIATEAVAKSPADGYTLLYTFALHYINHWSMKPSFDAIQDFEFVARVNTTPLILTTATSSPFKSVADVVAAARRDPNGLAYAAAGGPSQMAGAYMASLAGIQMRHVPYKEPSRVVLDTAMGVADLAFGGTTAALPLIKGGRLRALAVASTARLSHFPDVPTMAEAGVAGYVDVSSHGMVLAPKGTPAAIVVQLSQAFTSLAAEPGFKALCEAQSCEVNILDSAKLKASAPEEMAMWRRLVTLTNYQAN